jgi:hypothetical protein
MKRRIDKVAHSRAKDKEQAPQDGYRMIQAGWPLAMRLDLVCMPRCVKYTRPPAPNYGTTQWRILYEGSSPPFPHSTLASE